MGYYTVYNPEFEILEEEVDTSIQEFKNKLSELNVPVPPGVTFDEDVSLKDMEKIFP